ENREVPAPEALNPTEHEITFPRGWTGYHVVLAVWEVSNSPNAFYHTIDVDLAPKASRDGSHRRQQ
ncbi:MAG TPA: lytic polysaccharide monooxygenase, partial [Blastocatellia bacterium]|nr:lytic polysaccharide monooxygenase [Blastocatellia bacterium]